MNSAAPTLGVMVLDDHAERAAMAEESLIANGFRVLSVLSSASGLLLQIENYRPDVIVIDLQSPDRDVLESLAIVSAHNPTPIVMYSPNDDPAFIAEALQAGVTAYQGDGLKPEQVKTVIEVAMSQFRCFDILRRQLEETRSELADRKLIEQAKGLLAVQRGIDEATAFGLIRKLSMDNNMRMPDVAKSVLATLQQNKGDRDDGI